VETPSEHLTQRFELDRAYAERLVGRLSHAEMEVLHPVGDDRYPRSMHGT